MAMISQVKSVIDPVIEHFFRSGRDGKSKGLGRWFAREPYRWPHHVLFIAGLPKSGTNWIAQLLASVPGYQLRSAHDPHDCVLKHDICDGILSRLPWHLYSVLKSHTKFNVANLSVIEKYNLPTLVMYRDLRDQCVSNYFYILHQPGHRHHRYYNEIPKEEGLWHCIETKLEGYRSWIQGWLPILTERPDQFHEVRYEDLNREPNAVLTRVLDFYQIRLDPKKIASMVDHVASKTKYDLSANLRGRKGTARKGIVGDWRHHFTDEQVRLFKELCGDFLIQLGYEKDLSWGV